MADKKVSTRLQELRAMNDGELNAVLEGARRGIYQIRRERLSKPQEDVKATRNNKKEIARVLTIKRSKELAGATK